MKPYVKMFLIALCVNILIQTSIADNEGGKNSGEDNKDSAGDGKSQSKGVEQENQAGKNPGGETKAADGNRGVEQEKTGEAAAQSPDNPAEENGKGNELPKNPEGEGAAGSPQDNQGGNGQQPPKKPEGEGAAGSPQDNQGGNGQQPPKKPEGKDDSGIPRDEQGEGTDNGNKAKEPKGDEANGDEKTNQGKKPPKKTKEDGEDQEASEDYNAAGENSGAGESLYEPEPVNPEDIVSFNSISTERPEVQKEIIDCHNDIRKNVNPPATKMSKLLWSNELQKGAQEWADTCFFNHSTEENRTRPDTMLGENILKVCVPVTWTACTEVWLGEKKFFEYGNEGIDIYTCGHFTQMVADVTQQIGCAVSNCTVDGGFCNFYVCRYNPIGNEAGHYSRPYDAGKSCSRCHNCEQNSTLCLDICTVRDSYRNCPTYPKDRICPSKNLNDMCSVTCRCKPPPPPAS